MQFNAAGDREFWVRQWRNAKENSPTAKRRCRSEREQLEGWNRRAVKYARRTQGPKGEQRHKAVHELLRQENVLGPGVKVLDIGAGPGNFTVPMARAGAEVIALEPAVEMVRVMEKRLAEEKLSNVGVINRPWQEVALDEKWLRGGFDLVFASMTPGVNDPETLQKMLDVSRKYCYYSGHSGPRWEQAHRDLWRRLFNEDIGPAAGDILYPFGLLYASGYRPKTSFVMIRRVEEFTVEEAVENLGQFFWSYLDITAEIKQIIEDYVKERAENGIFRQEQKICHGMMLWRVDDRINA